MINRPAYVLSATDVGKCDTAPSSCYAEGI
jgi:hypothetical protein